MQFFVYPKLAPRLSKTRASFIQNWRLVYPKLAPRLSKTGASFIQNWRLVYPKLAPFLPFPSPKKGASFIMLLYFSLEHIGKRRDDDAADSKKFWDA